MEICGEHGKEIAYYKDGMYDDCPACKEVDLLKYEHAREIDDLNIQLDERDSRIDELRNQS